MILPKIGKPLENEHQSFQLQSHTLPTPAFSLTQLTTEPMTPVGFLQVHFLLVALIFFLTISNHLYI